MVDVDRAWALVMGQEVFQATGTGAGTRGRRISTTCHWPWRQNGHRVGSASVTREASADAGGGGAPSPCLRGVAVKY